MPVLPAPLRSAAAAAADAGFAAYSCPCRVTLMLERVPGDELHSSAA